MFRLSWRDSLRYWRRGGYGHSKANLVASCSVCARCSDADSAFCFLCPTLFPGRLRGAPWTRVFASRLPTFSGGSFFSCPARLPLVGNCCPCSVSSPLLLTLLSSRFSKMTSLMSLALGVGGAAPAAGAGGPRPSRPASVAGSAATFRSVVSNSLFGKIVNLPALHAGLHQPEAFATMAYFGALVGFHVDRGPAARRVASRAA